MHLSQVLIFSYLSALAPLLRPLSIPPCDCLQALDPCFTVKKNIVSIVPWFRLIGMTDDRRLTTLQISTKMKGHFMLCGLLATIASAHIQMSKPYPIRSPLNKNATGKKDYSYTNPLDSSGKNYPCKGYQNDPWSSQATYQPGGSYEMELEGSATHGGGSCQISLTYDLGKSFHVIESMLGNCPDPKKYEFTIPSDAPSGKALLAWSWFNKIGNREMYMNCAMVTIGGGSNSTEGNSTVSDRFKTNGPVRKTSKTHKAAAEKANRREKIAHGKDRKKDGTRHNKDTKDKKKDSKKATSFDNLPPIFVANVNQEGQCKTIEDQTVNFPMPGDDVMGQSDSSKGYTCSGNAPFLGSSSSSSSSTSSSNSSNTTQSRVPQAFGTVISDPRIMSTEASTNNDFKNYVGSFSCTSGEIVCSPDGNTWASCSNERPIYMGRVAAGSSCRTGRMVHAQ